MFNHQVHREQKCHFLTIVVMICMQKLYRFVSSFKSCFHSYISKVGVLKILVKANYKYIPSLDDILETSAVTCLRNQLLEAEHYQLAVEV